MARSTTALELIAYAHTNVPAAQAEAGMQPRGGTLMTSPDQSKKVVKSREGESHPTIGGIPAEDVKFAEVAVRVHCAISYPDGDRCLNCGPVYPCETYKWGRGLLLSVGYTADQIRELDTRTGPWS